MTASDLVTVGFDMAKPGGGIAYVRTGALRRAVQASPVARAQVGSAVKYAMEREQDLLRERLLGREESPQPSEDEPDFCPEGCYWDCEHRGLPGVAGEAQQPFLARYAIPTMPPDLRPAVDFWRDQLLQAFRLPSH